MLGRTRLYQSPGSPLIRGRSKPHPARRWLVVLLGAVVIAAGVWVYLTYLR